MMGGMARSRSVFGSLVDSFRLVVVLTALAIGGGAGAQERGQVADSYTGKTIADFDFARGMIVRRMKNAPRLGEMAPNFLLPEAESGKDLRLSELCRKKPVVLWFGSSTCGRNRPVDQTPCRASTALCGQGAVCVGLYP